MWLLFLLLDDGYNGCRYCRFGSRVKTLMLKSEHTAFKFMINKHVEEGNNVLVLKFFRHQPSFAWYLFRFPGFTTIWSVLRGSRLVTLKEDMFIAIGRAFRRDDFISETRSFQPRKSEKT